MNKREYCESRESIAFMWRYKTMKWYRINIDYLWYETDNAALETSSPAGKDKEKAIEQYKKTISENLLCCDDKTKPAKIDLIEYIYSKKTNRTRCNILCKNY